jgi:hypothetical protein
MAETWLIRLPKKIQSGDSFSWDPIDLQPLYPAGSGWTLTMYLFLVGAAPGTAPVTITATADMNSMFVLAQTPAQTAVWGPGEYHWTLIVQSADGTQRQTVDRGELKVGFNPAAPGDNYDPRNHEEKCLAAITAVLEGRMSESITEYKLDNGMEAKHMDHTELVRLRAYYAGVVRRQRGKSFFTHVPVRFNPL